MQPNAGDELPPRPAPGDDAAFTLYLVHLVRLHRSRCSPSPAAALAAGWPADHRDRGAAAPVVGRATAPGLARLALPGADERPHQPVAAAWSSGWLIVPPARSGLR